LLFLKLGYFSKPGREKSFDLPLKGVGQKTSTSTLELRDCFIEFPQLYPEIAMPAFGRLSTIEKKKILEKIKSRGSDNYAKMLTFTNFSSRVSPKKIGGG